LSHSSPRLVALALALAGCIPSITVGELPQTDTDGTSSTDDPTAPGTSGDTPTTGGPAVCGDGNLDVGEVCDDGNGDPDDGCDSACGRIGRVEWTVEPANAAVVVDLAVDGLGRIAISGFSGNKKFVLVLAPDGTEVWRAPVDATGKLAVHEDGRIFLGADEGAVHGLAADGTLSWTFAVSLGPEFHDRIAGLAVQGDALYSAAVESGGDLPGWRLAVRKHRLDTGAALWTTRTPDDLNVAAEEVVAAGDRIIVVGRTLDSQSLLITLGDAGTLLSTELGDPSARPMTVAAPIGDNDLVMAGFRPDPDIQLERRGADLDERWSVVSASDVATAAVATGPHEHVALAGFRQTNNRSSVVRLYDGGGTHLWTSTFADPLDEISEWASATGFGPDFLVVAGTTQTAKGAPKMWIRRFALD